MAGLTSSAHGLAHAASDVGRRFTFAINEGRGEARERRRRAVAEHLGNWVPFTVTHEWAAGERYWLVVVFERDVSAAAVAEFLAESPFYAAGTSRPAETIR
jgi:hypothetical protein